MSEVAQEAQVGYVMLMKLTREGAAEYVESLHAQMGEIQAAMENLGGTMTIVATLGEWDMVATGQAPSDEQIAWFAAKLSAGGGVTVTTMRAFSPSQWRERVCLLAWPTGHPFGH